MKKYRKRPVVIEAERYDGSGIVPMLVGYPLATEIEHPRDGYRLTIATPEGVMEARPGDWIIKGIKGEFYPCKPDVFAATYEPVEI